MVFNEKHPTWHTMEGSLKQRCLGKCLDECHRKIYHRTFHRHKYVNLSYLQQINNNSRSSLEFAPRTSSQALPSETCMAPYLQCLWNSPGVHPSGHPWNREQIIWQMLRGTSFQTIAGCKKNIDSSKLFRWFKQMRPLSCFWNPPKNMHKGAIHPTISFHTSGSPIYILDLIIKINEMSNHVYIWKRWLSDNVQLTHLSSNSRDLFPPLRHLRPSNPWPLEKWIAPPPAGCFKCRHFSAHGSIGYCFMDHFLSGS